MFTISIYSITLTYISPIGSLMYLPTYKKVVGVLVMKKTSLVITVPHLFTPMSALNADIKSYILNYVSLSTKRFIYNLIPKY